MAGSGGGGDFTLNTADIQMSTNYSNSPHNGWSPSAHPGGGGGMPGPLTAAVNASGLSPHHSLQ